MIIDTADEGPALTDDEQRLLAHSGAIKTLIEILAAKGVLSHAEVALLLTVQVAALKQAGWAVAAEELQFLLDYCEDPQRAQAHALRKATPAGSA